MESVVFISDSCGAQLVKHLPAMRETWVQFLGWEFPLEKEMATHSNILAWRIPWREEPGWATVHGILRVGHDSVLSFFLFFLNHLNMNSRMGRFLSLFHCSNFCVSACVRGSCLVNIC